MSDIQFYTLDTETTGLSLQFHEITEISVIRCSDRMQLTRRIRAHNPENASVDALRVTGQTMDDLRKGIEKLDMIREFEEFVSEDKCESSHRALICHNVSFDRKFLHALWEKYNKKFPFDLYVDTISLYRESCKQKGILKPRTNLTAAVESFGLKKYGQHNARDDTRHTYLLWNKLVNEEKIDWFNFVKLMPHIIE